MKENNKWDGKGDKCEGIENQANERRNAQI